MGALLAVLTRNPITVAGSVLATGAAIVMITLFGLELSGQSGGPYTGILVYLVLPGLFVAGLLAIPAGLWWERRRWRRAQRLGREAPRFPVLDFNRDAVRRAVFGFLVLTMVNVVILSVATYKAVEFMDSVEFCGQACHSVMHPEYGVYQRSPHAHVKCVECHIGPGASWFVQSKLSGAWQVVATTFDLYPRPIPTPIENLRPARETCEQCHWPVKFYGDRLKVITRFLEDEANTEVKTVLLLRVGGLLGFRSHGIHWHVDPQVTVRYRSDPTRERIYEVELTVADGVPRRYRRPGQDPPAELEGWRVMDCVDCHNRPTHTFEMPQEALDRALAMGWIPRELPYIRREGLRALLREAASYEEASRGIRSHLETFYRERYPDLYASKTEEIERAIERLTGIYRENVFPSMKVYWGTYPNHLGHLHFEGCFRCHDGLMANDGGETISQDCLTCHTILALEEPSPRILDWLQP